MREGCATVTGVRERRRRARGAQKLMDVAVGSAYAERRPMILTHGELCELGGAAGAAAIAAGDTVFRLQPPEAGRQTWTGGTVWDAGRVLAAQLEGGQLGIDWQSARVCELGTGCGLVGLTAAAMGAKEVWLTDHVLHVAKHNADANFSGADRRRIKLQRLAWGDMRALRKTGVFGLDPDPICCTSRRRCVVYLR